MAMYETTARSRDSPMDFAYDSPYRQRPGGGGGGVSSSWLEGHANVSASAMDVDVSSPPTIVGPDVEMTNDGSTRPPHVMAANEDHQSEEGRRIPSYGALTRMTRPKTVKTGGTRASTRRGNGKAKRGLYASENVKDESGSEWQDEILSEKKGRSASLRKQIAETLNVHFFNSDPGGGGHNANKHWMDPEWGLGMVQLAFNAALLVGVVWILFNVVLTLQRDVSSKVREYELEYLAEIEACSHSFHLNRCGTDGAVPALASACASWQRCSARDPSNVGRARVAAETVAEIVNGFVDVVSWKSMLFTLLSLMVLVGATNSFLSFFRIRSSQRSSDEKRRTSPSYPSLRHLQHDDWHDRAYTSSRRQQGIDEF